MVKLSALRKIMFLEETYFSKNITNTFSVGISERKLQTHYSHNNRTFIIITENIASYFAFLNVEIEIEFLMLLLIYANVSLHFWPIFKTKKTWKTTIPT